MAKIYRNFATQAALDAAYDVEAAVPDFMAYARQFVQSSDDARARNHCQTGVKYGPHVDEYADVFPAARRGAPILVFIHGGFWRMLAAGDFSFCAQGPQRAGVSAVVANYTLAPKAPMGEIVRQMRAVVAWCYRNAERLNGDREAIYVCGHSAGGHLTAMTLLTDWEGEYGLPATTVKGGIAISGLFDLEPIRRLSFVQPDLRLTADDVSDYSPAYHIRHVPAELLVTYGSDEPPEFLRQSDEFFAAWRQAGNRGAFLPQMGRNHFTAITDLAEPDSALCQAVFALMRHSGRRGVSRSSAAIPSVNALLRIAS